MRGGPPADDGSAQQTQTFGPAIKILAVSARPGIRGTRGRQWTTHLFQTDSSLLEDGPVGLEHHIDVSSDAASFVCEGHGRTAASRPASAVLLERSKWGNVTDEVCALTEECYGCFAIAEKSLSVSTVPVTHASTSIDTRGGTDPSAEEPDV
jgi:hypothetical protein